MLKNNISKIIAIIMVLCVGIVFVGCKNTQEEKELSKIEKIKKEGKIVVGTSADYPPYEFHKEVNKKDEIVGFDIEIAKEIAKDLGVKLEIKDMKFDGLLAALDSGNVDFVIAGMTPTEERAQKVDFTKVYYNAVQAVVVKTEDKDRIKSIDDLKGKKIGVQKGSIQEQIATNEIPEAKVKSLGKVSDLMLELKNSKVNAVIVEVPVADAYASKNEDIILTDIEFKDEEEGSAIAIKKGNEDLVESMNSTLDRLIKEKSIDKFVLQAIEMID
ncbi:transporter substrate-binding domain-containing protein [Tepidibacter formicigenes]|jgi:polar amino acid transport system substrate-binding protein|uniref:Amino acid ABC transporter substrate-binding protein, PAAT family (TC 3.A.1.3.-) n=1 Tax=Tepidibacter formicigenes DSM 15518 TaxID=1123349 RepID=A0A1M6RQQ3_9FIRM|nr:transporter substrate-binding domain-containing protein [Tepidibacter formicigenes]SHK34740.1 amino acid ABC transporter substrate-binding protein, PAAT family (TC 3.A.1.3.-) [Tepidibacter formicigenes DSM 15518]